MEKFRYSVILADSKLFDVVGSADVLNDMCNQLIVLTDKEFYSFGCQDNLIFEVINAINHEDILYVSKNQAHIYKMNCISENIACCFINDSTNDYVDVLVQHEVPNLKHLTRIQRPIKLS